MGSYIMNQWNAYLMIALTTCILGIAACGSPTKAGCSVGSEGCDCTPGGGCDPGLVCVGGTCVPDPGDTSTDEGVDPDVGGDDGGPADILVDDGSSTDTGTDDGSTVTGPPSCAGMAGDECGGADCCETLTVTGDWFAMGRGEEAACTDTPVVDSTCTTRNPTCLSGSTTFGCPEGVWLDLGGNDQHYISGGDDELPEHPARVDDFALDRFEVTVGRMRAFVEAYDRASLLTLMEAGAGSHPLITGSSWSSSWDSRLPDDRAALEDALACHDDQTWSDTAGSNETAPINCVSWYLAYAFCAWDGGRLPTGAEWEYAAAGGAENRLYPWGHDSPTISHANYLSSDNTPLVPVYAKPAGAGLWGQEGLGGSVWEWVHDFHAVDWYATGGALCQNCANLFGEGARVMRGGDWQYMGVDMRAASRFPGTAGAYWLGSGVRCARDL